MTTTAEAETADPGQAFAELMSGAAQQAAPPVDPEAPFGYTKDAVTGEMRPKKAPGRPRKSPSLDELKSEREAQPEAAQAPPEPDRAPDARRGRRRGGRKPPAAAQPDPGYQPGRIAHGMNKLYRRVGRIIAVADAELGQAFKDVTQKEDEYDLTVGEAWEELARTNPRVRRFLTKLIAGGAWGQLAMAHAPIALALLMKPAVYNHLPFARLLAALAASDAEDQDQGERGPGPDEGAAATPAPGGGPLDGLGLQPGDVEQMMGFAQGLAAKIGSHAHHPPPSRGPSTAPAHHGTRTRAQPQRRSRAQRRKAAA